MLFTAESVYGDIQDKVVGDFGCGCGILSIAANMMGAAHTIGLDIDPDALAIARDNCDTIELDVDFMLADLSEPWDERHPGPFQPGRIDTIIMNPPFGTKLKGIDMVFLRKAIELAGKAVYSLHKTSTREHILRKSKEWEVECEVLAELKFNVPMMYKFHKKKSVDIEVDFMRFAKRKR